MAASQGSNPPSRVPNHGQPSSGKAEALGGQAAAAARAAMSFYRGWRANRTGEPNPIDVERAHRQATHASAMSRYRNALIRLRTRLAVGTATVVGGAAVAASTLDGLPSEAPLAVVGGSAVVIGAWQAIRSSSGLKELHVPAPPPALVAPPPALPPGSAGSDAAQRVTGLRMHIMELLPTLDQLHPEAADQIRAADAATALGLNALVERVRSMQRIIRQLPGSPAAQSAQISINALTIRLQEGASAYQELLTAVITLSSAPALTGGPAATLRPAIDDMHAYAAGLQRAAETWN
jgi:hypothetical protein